MRSQYLISGLASLAMALPQPQHSMHRLPSLITSRTELNLLDEVAVEEAFQAAVKARDARQQTTRKRANQLIPVVVGGAQVLFMPNMMLAAVGDVIQFQFAEGNHTVTQSTETEACQPMQKTVPTAVHSGHIPFKAGQTTVGTFNVPITDTKPMFLYCATGPHCQLGQVMIINPSNTAQVVNYAKLSAQAKANVDGGAASGGSVASIQLSAAAFVPAPAEMGGSPPAAPPAGAPAGGAPAQPAPGAGNGTTPAPGNGKGGKDGKKGKDGGKMKGKGNAEGGGAAAPGAGAAAPGAGAAAPQSVAAPQAPAQPAPVEQVPAPAQPAPAGQAPAPAAPPA
ncbi:hypothetical protein MAPG_04826 [Magnaporthiopsis poae ATCC 64411]|uniref:Extracellular serine-rich protein n=1 Tax=Magnaporthiopsis poae (strain ATCC 64411 / 73-15) TaxID=644358 RepID=A0A0C4DXR9_MAGP6|nr:hypothetical protein MAPG_04826 [Magnaporthiopsis poae ATCC 64411]